jgi:hypothetical protein
MGWETYKPKPRGATPRDFGIIVATLKNGGDTIYLPEDNGSWSNRPADVLAGIVAAAKKAGFAIKDANKPDVWQYNAESKRYRLKVTRV